MFTSTSQATPALPFPQVFATQISSNPAPKEKRRSVSGNIFFLSKGPISWSSKRQEITAESTMQSEYISLWYAGRQASWFRSMAEAIEHPLSEGIKLYCDSESAIALATCGEVAHKGAKHFDVKYHSTRDRVERNEICIEYVPTQDNLADFLTKQLPPNSFINSRDSYSASVTHVLQRKD